MAVYKKKWWLSFLIHLLIPVVFYFIGFALGYTPMFTIICVCLATGINYTVTMYFSYYKAGTRWLLWMMIINAIAIPSNFIHSCMQLFTNSTFHQADVLGFFFPFSIPFVYYSYKIREFYMNPSAKAL